MLHVPYKGGGPAATALLSGEIDMMFEQTYAALPSIQAGKTRALAVTSDKRLPSLPDVPTMAELGYPQVTVSNWLGIVAPKGTPPAVVRKVNEAFNKALAMPDMREKIAGPGNVVGGGTPEEFAALHRRRDQALARADQGQGHQAGVRPLGSSRERRMYAYVGSRTTRERNARGEGISVFKVDPRAASLEQVQLVGGLVNPSYLALSRRRRRSCTAVHGDRDRGQRLQGRPARPADCDSSTGRARRAGTRSTWRWTRAAVPAS